VGVLAAIAVVGYRKYMLAAKVTEGKGVISAIRIAQEDYKAEKGSYADIGATFCPTGAGVSDTKWGWDPTCSGGGTNVPATWNALPVHIDGPVQFAYATKADTADLAGAPLGTSWVSWGTPHGPWYVVAAYCDLDGNGADRTDLASSSFGNQIFSQHEGQ
jgi:type IV pilus assembly protein PilA